MDIPVPLAFIALMDLGAGFTISELTRMNSQEQHWRLLTWFHSLYVDPDLEPNARFRWPPSGDIMRPIEELLATFGAHIARQTLRDVASDLDEQSTNWRVRPDEIKAESQGRDGVLRAGTGRAGDRLVDDVETMRRELLVRIAALERSISELQWPEPAFGHNNPPDGLDDLPASKGDIRELRDALNSIRAEIMTDKPRAEELKAASGRLKGFAWKLGSWIGARSTKFMDAAMTTAGTTAGAGFVLAATGLLPQVNDVSEALDNLARLFGIHL